MSDLRDAAGGVVKRQDGVVQGRHDAARKNHQRFGQYLGQRQVRRAGHLCQRVLFRQRYHQRFAGNQQALQAGRHRTGGVQQKTGVNLTALQRALLHIPGGLNQLQLNAGMPLPERPDPARQQVKPNGGHKRQAQPPGFAVGVGTGEPRQGLCAHQQVTRFGHQRRARHGQLHAAFGAVKQFDAQQHFELCNRLCQRGLGHVELLGSAAKVQRVGHGQKLPPQTQLDQRILRATAGHVFASFHTHGILIQRKKWIGKNKLIHA